MELKEAIGNQKKFELAMVGGIRKRNSDMRSNSVAYYDEIYKYERKDSILLKSIDKKFANTDFREILGSAPTPISLFGISDTHETQVSRYGDTKQEYKYHTDTHGAGTTVRQLTMVYYFNKEPKRYKGGDITFTNCPIVDGKTIMKKPKTFTLTPENNMGVVFGTNTAHRVLPTWSPKTFGSGRFSVNIWIGVR